MFGIIAAPVLAATMPKMSDLPLSRTAIHAMLIVAVGSFFWRIGQSFPGSNPDFCEWLNRPHLQFHYPCKACDWVDANVTPTLPNDRPGRLINEFTWGGYLAWRLGPRYQTLLDGRTQTVFAEEFWRSTLLAPDDDARAAFLARVNADVAIIPVQKSRFRTAVRRSSTGAACIAMNMRK